VLSRLGVGERKMVNARELKREVEGIVKQLIEVYKPQRIILFGSLFRGKIKESSDIDLFIIKKDIPELGVERIRQLDSLIKYRWATDFIVYKPEEVEERLKLGDPFIKSIIEKGKVLYEA
jgi:predicted nucleotidyltransferase